MKKRFRRKTKTTEERLLSKVQKTKSCWNWISSSVSDSGNGYGILRVDGKSIHAHRVSYELYIGPIEDSLYVLHKCDNKLCVNPNHLFLGTHKENMEDKVKKNIQMKGEDVPSSMLNKKQVLEIRYKYSLGNTSFRKLAKEYKVSYSCINYVIDRRTWKHL